MENKYSNKLINETSPYLLQHANNPVDWFPWCDEAFDKAINKNKPVFLSIGYSTCHWCHVMEKESFEDIEVAKVLNENFISIKVDREERPDIDNLYMKVCMLMNGSGGWPMSLFLTPNKKPFLAGTYFPKYSTGRRIGFMDLLQNITDAWKSKQNEIELSADDITNHIINSKSSPESNANLNPDALIKNSVNYFNRIFDAENGGFGSAPKFPSLHNVLFLLRTSKILNDKNLLNIAADTLAKIRLGGIFDQIGFGLHRYSTDKMWLVPHFEKMLYDQAMAVYVYSEAYLYTKNILFKNTVYEIFKYLSTVMKNENGLFFSAEDADSEGIEGKFYVWTYNEIKSILNEDEFIFAARVYNIKPEGNFLDEFSHSHNGNNIFHMTDTPDKTAAELNMSGADFSQILDTINSKLQTVRSKRIHPFKDEKILTDWNALLIAALAKAANVFQDEIFLSSAVNCNNSIFKKYLDANGFLLHTVNSDKNISANLDDYAFLIWAQIELHKSTADSKYLTNSIDLFNKAYRLFNDSENGGFFFSAEFNKDLFSRSKEFYDGAEPSGNSVLLACMNYLQFFTNDIEPRFLNKSKNVFLDLIDKYSGGYSFFMSDLILNFDNRKDLLVVYKDKENLNIVKNYFARNYSPEVNLYFINQNSLGDFPALKNYSLLNGMTTFYFCSDFTCSAPTNNFSEINFYHQKS